MRKYIATAAAAVFLSACTTDENPKNVILMIGDGMGPAYTSGYRYFVNDNSRADFRPTVFTQTLVGNASTFPADPDSVTDSAASATAMAAGIKTLNGAVGVDADGQPVDSVLKHAKQVGMRTGLVATSEIYHATPAAFVAHNVNRGKKHAIARDFVNQRHNDKPLVDVFLGGGRKYFDHEETALWQKLEADGYHRVDDFGALENAAGKRNLVGLFADSGLPYAIDSDVPDRLQRMTRAALASLAGSEKGFFLMVEGSQIDWCGHNNDIACAMKEMEDFAASIEVVLEFMKANPDTLLVVTADHDTGGPSIGREGSYRWMPKVIRQVRASQGKLKEVLLESEDIAADWARFVDFPLEDDEIASLVSAQQYSRETKARDNDPKSLYARIADIINRRTGTGWTTHGHTGEDVQVFAAGKSSEQFRGNQDNTDIGKKLIALVRN